MLDSNKSSPPMLNGALQSAELGAKAAPHRWTSIRKEFGAGWQVLLTAIVGSALGMASLPIFTLPLFIGPLHDDFGWPRSEVAMALTVLTAMIFLCGPMAGRLADRIGVRIVIFASIVLFALGMLAISQVNGSVWWFYAGYLVIGIGGAGTTYVSYSRALNTWFNSSRGLALGLMMTGPGLIAALAPLVLPEFIAAHGWRSAWMLMSAATLVPLPFAILFIREKKNGELGRGAPTAGFPLKSVLRMRQFWLLLIATFMMTFSVSGTYMHFMGILGELGVPKADAAGFVSVIGVSMLVGRLICGTLLDLLFAPIVGVTLILSSACGLLWAALGGNPLFAAIGIGLITGTEADFIAYAATRYFGLRAYAEIFGWLFGVLALGAACSPLWLGRLHDFSGGYQTGLLISAGLLAFSACCVAGLGKYPQTVEDKTPI